MTRNVHLLRRLLLEAESGALLAPDVSDAELQRHVLLLEEAGYVQAQKPSSIRATRWGITAVTWRGHEVLDTIRDESAWQAIAAVTEGGVAFEAVLDVFMERARELLAQQMRIQMGP